MMKQAEDNREPETTASKEATSIDGINEYLKKLKELRDQTAVERIIIKKAEAKPDTQKMDAKEVEAPVKKYDEDTEKMPMKLEQEDKIEEKVEPKPEMFLEKEPPKTKQYPISDKFVVKKDEDTFMRKTVNVVRDSMIRKNRPKMIKARSQSVDHPKKDTSPINRTIALKTIRSEDLTKKVLAIRATPKVKPQQSPIRPVLMNTENVPKKITLKPKPSLEKPQGRLAKATSSKELTKVDTNTMKKIMEQYRVPVKVEFRMSMAEMKRINRRKRREREKRLKAEAKMQEKKFQEEALKAMQEKEAAREQDRKHRYRLEDLVTAVKEALRGKEKIVLEEAKEEVLKTEDAPGVLDETPKEKQEVVLKEDVVKAESGIEEKLTCSTSETKVVNYTRKPEEAAPTDLGVNEDLINKIVKGAGQEIKTSAEGILSKPKGIKDKTDDKANEGVYTVKKEGEDKATERKEKKQKVKYPKTIMKAVPRHNLGKASDKKQLLQKNSLQLDKKVEDGVKSDLESMKSQAKLKTKKAKVKTQVLGKRKDLPHKKDTSEETQQQDKENKEKRVATDVETIINKELQEMRNRMKEFLEKQGISARKDKPKNNLDAAVKTTKGVEQQEQSIIKNNLEDTNISKENEIQAIKTDESTKKAEESNLKTSQRAVNTIVEDSTSRIEKTDNIPIKQKDGQALKDPEKMSIKEIEEEEKQLLKKIDTLRLVKGKYLLSPNLKKDIKQESERVKEDATKAQKEKVEVPKAAEKRNGEEKQQIERHKLEDDLKNHEDIVKVVNEKQLLQVNSKQAVKDEPVKENLGVTKGKASLDAPEKTDSTGVKQKELKTSKKEKEEKLEEKATKTLLVKEKEDNLKETAVEEEKEKENLQTSALQHPKHAMNKSLSITLEDKEIQILIKNVEKTSDIASDEKNIAVQETGARINFKNIQEEIKNRVPTVKIKKITSHPVEKQIPKQKMKKMPKKPEEDVIKCAPEKERAVKDLKKAVIKTIEPKGLRKPEKPRSEITPVQKPMKHLKNVSLDRRTLPEKKVQDKDTEASLSEKRKQTTEKCPNTENHIVNKFSRLQQENVAKLKEASTKIVKLVKKMDLIKYTHKPEQRAEKLTLPNNQPTIRRDPLPKSKEKRKKDQPKSKTDIVLPPQGRNDPKTATKSIPFEDPRRNFVEEINKVLSKVTHSVPKEEKIKKCKSLADVAGEQKAKILKEIEVTWNKENNKSKEQSLACPDSRECQGMDGSGPINTGIITDYYDEMKDLPEKRKLNLGNTAFCTRENTKDRVSKLPIKIKSKCQCDNLNLTRMEVQKKTDEANEGVKTPRMGYTLKKPVSSYSTPRENHQDVMVFKGGIDTPQLDKGEGRSTLHMKKTKRARIEDDFLKVDVRNVEPNESWHSQHDSDFSFTKLKRARIEDDFIANEKKDTKESTKNILEATNEKWRNKQDSTLCLQKLRRGRIEDDFEATEQKQSDQQVPAELEATLADRVVKKQLVKSASEAEIGAKVAPKNSNVKSDVEKLIHVMKKADKELEEVLKVYEILKIPKPQHRNLMKLESHTSRKQEKPETKLRGSADLVPIKKPKRTAGVKDSKTYTVGTKKTGPRTNNLGEISETKSQTERKKPSLEQKEDSGKQCKEEKQSTKATDKPHKYLLTAVLQKEARKQLKGKKEEVKCNHSDNETAFKKRKRAKICQKDGKSCNAKEVEDKIKQTRTLLFPEVKKAAILTHSKPEAICDKPAGDTGVGEKIKDSSDTKLSVQPSPNELDVLVNRIVAIRSPDAPVAKPKEMEKREEKTEQQDKQLEIPGKRKTNLRTEEQHVSISTDIPHTTSNKNARRVFDGSVVERRASSRDGNRDTKVGYNENNLSESSIIRNESKLKNSKSTADFRIVRSNLIDMFIKSKRNRNRKDKNVRTIFINRKVTRGINRNKSCLRRKSKSEEPPNKTEHSQKALATPEAKKEKRNKPTKRVDVGRPTNEEEKIVKFAQNAMENILLTKYLLQQQLEFLEAVALPAKTAVGDNSDKFPEKSKLRRTINLKQSGETHCGNFGKSGIPVAPPEKILEIREVRESMQDLKTKFEEFLTTETIREETGGCMSNGNSKIDGGDCRKVYLGQNLKNEAFERRDAEHMRVIKTEETSSNCQLDRAHKKVRHSLSTVNDRNVNLKKNISIEKEINKTEKENADEKVSVEIKQDDTKLRKDKVLDQNLNTNVDWKNTESGRQTVNDRCNAMESKHELGKETDGTKLKGTSEDTVKSEDGNKKSRKERQAKTHSNKNQIKVEEGKTKLNDDKTSLKSLETSRKGYNVGVMTNSKSILTENNSKPKTPKDPHQKNKMVHSANRPTSRTQSNVELRPISPFYKTKENIPKEKKLTAATEPCLSKFTINKTEEKNKYKYTTQKIRQSLMKPTDTTKGRGKRDWQTRVEEAKTSLHPYKKQKTGAETTDNRYRIQLKTNYTYTSQNLKQNLMRRDEHNVNDIRNENKKRIREDSASGTTLRTRKKQKTDLEATTSRAASKVTQGPAEADQVEDKEGGTGAVCLITGVKSGYVAPRNSDSDVRLHLEQSRAEEKLKKVFAYYLSNKEYFKTKYAEDKGDEFEISYSTTKQSQTRTKVGNTLRKPSILNRVKRNALPTVEESQSEDCKEEGEKDDERKLVIPKYFIESDNVHNAILSPLRLTEKLIRKLSSEKMDYDQDNNKRNSAMTAHIEQIFKKYYKEDEKIYRFNKHLIRYLRQPGEKAPRSLHKHQLILSLEPAAVEENQMQGMLWRLIASEFKESEDSQGFSIFKNCKSWEGTIHCSKNREDNLPEASPKRSTTFYIEKTPRNRYAKEKSQEPLPPVTRCCDMLCLPLKAISQVALRPSVEEMTTLNKYHVGRIQVAPKIPDALEKYKDLKITYINIKRPMGKRGEGFLPRIIRMDNDNEAKALEKVNDPQKLKRQILEFRYELLRKLHKEFSALYDKDVNRNQGKFDKVSKYYNSVIAREKSKDNKGIAAIQETKSIVEIFGPSTKPSFEKVARYYNLIMEKSKGKENGEEWNKAKVLVQKLPAEGNDFDKSRNNCKDAEQILTKSGEQKDSKGKGPEDPEKGR